MKSCLKISLRDIKSNWKLINKASNGKAAAVIKANAYGMGMLKIAESLIEVGCNYFYVANVNEAIELRKKYNSNDVSIAIFEGYFEGYQKIYYEYNLIPILNSVDQLIRLSDFATEKNQSTRAILNIDTGMNRLGLNQEELNFLLRDKSILDKIELDFIMSHLANATKNKDEKNIKQLKKIKDFSANFPNIKISLANSAGIKLGSNFCLDQTRPGIALYGIDNFGKSFNLNSRNLKLPIKLYAPILQVRNAPFGETVSYDGIDILKRSSKLATIGIGYADGWLRLLKPNSSFLVGDKSCRIVGNITMDSFVLDITDVKSKKFKEGDYICLLDNSNFEYVLKNNDIISYELLSIMGNRVLREY